MKSAMSGALIALVFRYICALLLCVYLGLLLEGIRMGAYNLLDYQNRLDRTSYPAEWLLYLPGRQLYYKEPVYLYVLLIVSLCSALRALVICLREGLGEYAYLKAGSSINFGAIVVISLFLIFAFVMLVPAMPIL